MQVYKGLDIITNKASLEEQGKIPHHLLSFLQWGQDYRVNSFVRDACGIIGEIHDRQSLPVVVGGTNYYLQNLIWADGLISNDQLHVLPESQREVLTNALQGPDSHSLWTVLNDFDPVSASKWHPSDTRRVRRSLEVLLATGKKHSEVIQEQIKNPRFRTLVFWLYSDFEVLDQRLEKRCREMMDVCTIQSFLDLFLNSHLIDSSGFWKRSKPFTTSTTTSLPQSQNLHIQTQESYNVSGTRSFFPTSKLSPL